MFTLNVQSIFQWPYYRLQVQRQNHRWGPCLKFVVKKVILDSFSSSLLLLFEMENPFNFSFRCRAPSGLPKV